MADSPAKVRAAEAIRLTRAGMSASRAARQAGTTVSTMRAYFGPTVRRRRGRLRVAASDEVSFTMRVMTTDGIQVVEVKGSTDRSLVGAHHNAVAEFLDTGNTEPLAVFSGVTVGGVGLETDPDRLIEAWRAGQFDFLEIYQPDF